MNAQHQDQPQEHQQANSGDSSMSTEQTSRVWRACLECRKKKSKCDGKDVCNRCMVRNKECVYPPSNDNASSSRQMVTTFQAQCQHMEALCQRMESLMGQFSNTVEHLNTFRKDSRIDTPPEKTPMRAEGEVADSVRIVPELDQEELNSFDSDEVPEVPLEQQYDESTEGVANEEELTEEFDHLKQAIKKQQLDHVMTTDSYGKLRYVGGASTMLMIEALNTLSPTGDGHSSSPHASETCDSEGTTVFELPFFNRSQTWPRLACLPRPEKLERPPRYLADVLVNLYFDHLHYTMPVVYKPHFMRRYELLMSNSSSMGADIDAGFLATFFGVCACAAGLLPRETEGSSTFAGFKYYENAIMLHYASTGEGTIEQVQTLTLLSMCSAGWNTLAQSWKFAGQAVRAAQDLGLHRSPARGAGETLKEELCRRIWWSVYTLDRVLSICLGRPMGVEDVDCDCEMPLDIDNSEFEDYCRGVASPTPKNNIKGLTGFIAFSSLCKTAGKIIRSMSPIQLNSLRAKSGLQGATNLRKLVDDLDQELMEWLQQVPESIKSSVNNLNAKSPHLAMCVISYILHAGCVINLHLPLIPKSLPESGTLLENRSYQECVNAVGSCIQVGGLIKQCVLPSHHLAFCAHYLALSGVFLLRSSPYPLNRTVTNDIESCIRHLTDLENVWIGARRSRLILEELFKRSNVSSGMSKKRGFGEIDMDDVFRSNSRHPDQRQRMTDRNGLNQIGGAGDIDEIWTMDYDGFDVLAMTNPVSRQDLFSNFL